MVTLTWYAGEYHEVNYDNVVYAKQAAQLAADQLAKLLDLTPVNLPWDKNNCANLGWVGVWIKDGALPEAQSNLAVPALFRELNIVG